MRHTYPCPECGQTVHTDAGWRARGQGRPRRACVRTRNGWTCPDCGSADPHHEHSISTHSGVLGRDLSIATDVPTDEEAQAWDDAHAERKGESGGHR